MHCSSASATSFFYPKSVRFLHSQRQRISINFNISANGFSFSAQYVSQYVSLGPRERSKVITAASSADKEKKEKKKKKVDSHSFVSRPDESTGPFPEAVLLKEKNAREDGRVLPEFADAEEENLFEFLNLQLESQLDVDKMRHYEVVYLIHEDHVEEVGSVISKVEDFIKEKNGKIWRLNNWGLRRLAYKIKKAKNANYILMNFELAAKWINDFKSMLDKDERIIRHLVIKRDEAITEDCPPPPEFHTLHANIMEEEDIDEVDPNYSGGQDWDDESELVTSDTEDGIIYVDDDGDDEQGNEDDGSNHVRRGARTNKPEKIAR